jgi:cytochrome P450
VSIVSERDPIKHREVRKSLSHAFSAKALRLQTELVLKYVDRLVDQITKQGNAEHGINVGEVS